MIGFIGTSLILQSITTSQSMTVLNSLHSLLDYECLLFHSDWLGSDLRVGHFFSFGCPHVNTPQLNLNFWILLRMNDWTLWWMNSPELNSRIWVWVLCYDRRLTTRSLLLSDSCGFVDLGRPLWTRGRVCPLKLLLASPAQSFWGSSPLGLMAMFYCLSSDSRLPFRRLLRLAGSRWRYSTPPPHGCRSNSRINYVSPFHNIEANRM
jgi:hypothetical protein